MRARGWGGWDQWGTEGLVSWENRGIPVCKHVTGTQSGFTQLITSVPSHRKYNTSAHKPVYKEVAQVKAWFIRTILSLSKRLTEKGIIILTEIQITLY